MGLMKILMKKKNEDQTYVCQNCKGKLYPLEESVEKIHLEMEDEWVIRNSIFLMTYPGSGTRNIVLAPQMDKPSLCVKQRVLLLMALWRWPNVQIGHLLLRNFLIQSLCLHMHFSEDLYTQTFSGSVIYSKFRTEMERCDQVRFQVPVHFLEVPVRTYLFPRGQLHNHLGCP